MLKEYYNFSQWIKNKKQKKTLLEDSWATRCIVQRNSFWVCNKTDSGQCQMVWKLSACTTFHQYEQLMVRHGNNQTSSNVLLPAFLHCRAGGLLWSNRPLARLTAPQAASISPGFPEQWLTWVLINASADSDTSLEPSSCHVKETSTLRCSRHRASTPSHASGHAHRHTHGGGQNNKDTWL